MVTKQPDVNKDVCFYVVLKSLTYTSFNTSSSELQTIGLQFYAMCTIFGTQNASLIFKFNNCM